MFGGKMGGKGGLEGFKEGVWPLLIFLFFTFFYLPGFSSHSSSFDILT
jgi:hypothetical protein